MSVTIIGQPGTHTPAYNHQYFIFDSTNKAQTNFSYVIAVNVDGNITTLKLPPRPDNGYAYFNPQHIVESYVENKFTDTNLLVAPNFAENSIKYVTVGCTEEYGSPVSGFAGSSANYYVWNAAYNTAEFEGYLYNTTAYAKDLTLAPSYTETIHYDQKLLHKTWHRGFATGDLRFLTVAAYDSAGTLMNTSILETQYYNIPTNYRYNLAYANISPAGLNLMKTGLPPANVAQTNALLDVVPSNTAQYIVYWTDGSNQRSNYYYINIDTLCSKYSRYVLHFLNRLGNYDSFTFYRKSIKTSEHETKTYKKLPFELSSGGNAYVYYNHKHDEINYSTVITNKITLNTDWITDAQATWLKDLLHSPSVILEDSNGATFAVKVVPKNYEEKMKVNDKCFSLTVEVEYTYQDIRQRG